jgi:beta-barrel assembly-enhancing protease
MGGFFYKLGRMVGPKLRQASWVYHSATGSEADAVRAEYAVGRDLAQAYAQQSEIDTDPVIQLMLDDIGNRLVRCVKSQERQFLFRAVRSSEFNAFALPGGFIFVMRPLIEFCGRDADEVAFVLGHEMSHVIKRHAIERMMASSLIQGAMSRLPVGGALGAPVVHMATAMLSQGYSQDNELEADALGVKLMSAAGFDASGGIRVLNRLRTIPTEAWMLSGYLSSHPPIELRISQIERMAQR